MAQHQESYESKIDADGALQVKRASVKTRRTFIQSERLVKAWQKEAGTLIPGAASVTASPHTCGPSMLTVAPCLRSKHDAPRYHQSDSPLGFTHLSTPPTHTSVRTRACMQEVCVLPLD